MKKRKWLILSFSIVILGVLILGVVDKNAKTNVITHSNLSFSVPNDSDVKSVDVWRSELPGSTRATFTFEYNKTTIDQILTWLKNSKEIGPEKQKPIREGYPPGLSITTNSGSVLTIVPARNWTVSELPNGSTSITGVPATGYIAVRSDSSSILLYSPDLYDWISNARWYKAKNDTSTK